MLDGDAPFHDDRYRFGGLTLVGVLVSDQPLGREGRKVRRGGVRDRESRSGTIRDERWIVPAKLSREALEPVPRRLLTDDEI